MSVRYINREGYISDAMECTRCGAQWAARHSTTHACATAPSLEAAAEKYADETWPDTPMSGKPKNEYLYRLSSKALARSAYLAGWKAAFEKVDPAFCDLELKVSEAIELADELLLEAQRADCLAFGQVGIFRDRLAKIKGDAQ